MEAMMSYPEVQKKAQREIGKLASPKWPTYVLRQILQMLFVQTVYQGGRISIIFPTSGV